MDEFKVKLGLVRSSISKQEKIARELSEISNELYTIKNSLRFKVAQRERIDRRLLRQGQRIGIEKEKMRTLSGKLSDIADLYEKTESALCSMEGNGEESGNRKSEGIIFDWRILYSARGFNWTDTDTEWGR